jgi:hypothetical protein
VSCILNILAVNAKHIITHIIITVIN